MFYVLAEDMAFCFPKAVSDLLVQQVYDVQ